MNLFLFFISLTLFLRIFHNLEFLKVLIIKFLPFTSSANFILNEKFYEGVLLIVNNCKESLN